MDDWVVSKRILFLSDRLEVAKDVTDRHLSVIPLAPGDDTREAATVTEPLVRDSARRLVVGDENAVELSGSLEVHVVHCSFGEGLDRSDNIPAALAQGVHEMAVNVGIAIQRKPASHSARYDVEESRRLRYSAFSRS